MPTFATPEPVTLRLRVQSGDILVEASDRADTEVEVRPYNSNKQADTEAAQQTLVEQRDGSIVVEAPDGKEFGRFGRSGSIYVRVALPTGSHLRGTKASADLRAVGRLGDVDLNTASGDVELQEVDKLEVQTASGDVTCRLVGGSAKVQSASGDITLGEVGGDLQVASASGDLDLGPVGGDVRVQTASGDTTVAVAGGSVEARSASGDVSLPSVRSGQVSVETASGDVTVGIAAGVAAWLDVSSLSGDVHSDLDDAGEPGEGDESVELRARTLSGDVSIVRAR
ncbi:DUF4097 family beta strand repeat-containing protein [Actinopolymorpha singaporensis]|uniref:Putative adhesin n=1 Tax=Actinopolymorpha singaporensis TaxID=117157 RepID=A0A1H1NRK0_9ACTN|nr:DUF4097 family beta strand repeat-containing protein [Actinopolymorpha singaporensis]SDS01614.1 Putative adhesin [Actinopolymorpha singaporensis]